MQTKTFSIKNSLGFAWRGVTSNFWLFIGIMVIGVVISAVLSGVAQGFQNSHLGLAYTLMRLVVSLIEIYFMYRLIVLGNKLYLGETIHFSDMYEGGSARTYLKYIASNILKMLFVFPVVIIGVILFLVTHMFQVPSNNIPTVVIFVALMVIAGVMYSILVFFTSAAVIVGGKGPWDALVESIQISNGVRGKIFLLMLACFGIILISCIPFGLGLFVTLPMMPLILVHAYHTLKGDTPIVTSPNVAHE
jgi:hypothetical protein